MRALVCGITGQDGAYLADLLLRKGYEVWGTSRDASTAPTGNLQQLGVLNRVKLLSMNAAQGLGVREALEESRPDELYWLAGQSSVGQSYQQPVLTVGEAVMGALNVLQALRESHASVRFCHASSGEIFGDLGPQAADERSAIHAASPYAASKAAVHTLVQCYRDSYGLFASNAICFNHESPLRQPTFVTRKIVMAAARAGLGGAGLTLGRMDIHRDWGWAPDYVDGMWLMLQTGTPDDFVLATGKCHSLTDFVARAYAFFGLDWRDHVRSDPALFRPKDRAWSQGNPSKAQDVLGWSSRHDMPDVVHLLCEAERDVTQTQGVGRS